MMAGRKLVIGAGHMMMFCRYLNALRAMSLAASDLHGADGGLAVSKIRAKSKISEAFIQSAVEMGVPYTDDYNGEDQEGVAYFDQTARKGFVARQQKPF